MSWAIVIEDVELVDPSLDDDGEIHLYCEHCDPEGKLAFCGTELADGEFIIDDGYTEATCVVCADMGAGQCPRCGAWP